MPDWVSLVEQIGLPAVLLIVVVALHWRLVSRVLDEKNAEIARLRGERDHFRDRAEAASNHARRRDDDG